MKFTQSLVSLALATVAVASPTPTPTLEKRATTICGQWDTVATGTYTVFQNLWNITGFTGSQCSTVTSDTSNSLVWSTSWSWAGGSSQVKSYANVGLNMAAKQVSAISTIPSTWKWSYTGTNLVADVSYDLFSSSTGTGSADYEIMIWLSALGGAGPISSTGSTPIATPTIAGVSWKLFSGLNGATRVYSFVASSTVNSFSGDLKTFLTYLTSSQAYPSSQYLTTIQAGTEPFTGSNAVFKTTAYSVSLK
ncbi:putative xyloglucan-specific endo-beta glucanase precursor protein [Botrytis fragariae]|uniref:Putative xyloglucan-specific endo-beta glucanase protein n=1 Tax=Botrytis fragariae TaxID=1964551 RepID=A0A8H6B4P5_9HELO|nr:putative xyloglucan-specific endo-beta glucanase precursor protein [Botrytis fragariae]KAF5879368.1 putative xyloglucan-specific endo-beta glucanase precursor protein [Botrytis fragariae]